MDFEMKPIYLLAEELAYELRIRGVITNRKDLTSQRKILARLLSKEVNKDLDWVDPNYDFVSEKEIVTKILDSIRDLISEFSGPETDCLCSRIKSRLVHITRRIKRILIPDNDELGVRQFKNESNATCIELEAELFDKIVGDQDLSNNSNLSQSLLNTTVVNRSLNNTMSIREVRCDPVYKWGVQFDGTPCQLNSFLERVDELAQARDVDKTVLFRSAVDLFTDKALLWFRSIRCSVNDWDDLVSLLRKEFLPSDFDDRLWDEIKARKQGRGESANIYITAMQTLFSRLSKAPAEQTKLKCIRKNLQPLFIDKLALQEIDSVSQLSELCRKISIAEENKKAFYNKDSKLPIVEPSLAFVSESSISRQVSGITNISSKCWNYKRVGHLFSTCRAQRTKFCHRCGKPSVTTNSCPNCSKNGSRT